MASRSIFMYFLMLFSSYTYSADDLDLREWEVLGSGVWESSSSQEANYKSVNGKVTALLSSQMYSNHIIRGHIEFIEVSGVDEYVGIVLGHNDDGAIVYNWKQQTGQSMGGWSLLKVKGSLNTLDPLSWEASHINSSKIEVLSSHHASSNTTSGWEVEVEYPFEIVYKSNKIRASIGGNTFELDGEFEPGRLGFFNKDDNQCIVENYPIIKECPSGHEFINNKCVKEEYLQPNNECLSGGTLNGNECNVFGYKAPQCHSGSLVGGVCRANTSQCFYDLRGSNKNYVEYDLERKFYLNNRLVCGDSGCGKYWTGRLRTWVGSGIEIYEICTSVSTTVGSPTKCTGGSVYDGGRKQCKYVSTTYPADKVCPSGMTLNEEKDQCVKKSAVSYFPRCESDLVLSSDKTACERNLAILPPSDSCPVSQGNFIIDTLEPLHIPTVEDLEVVGYQGGVTIVEGKYSDANTTESHTCSIESQPNKGQVRVVPPCSFEYVAPPFATNSDEFTYRVLDSGYLADQGLVNVDIAPTGAEPDMPSSVRANTPAFIRVRPNESAGQISTIRVRNLPAWASYDSDKR
ncbi:hypothetical protein, partial [Enterovibrio norvegicus]|uniref:hypothetical protein n=1 Tax=Enterovibrio norvegicus TaxID=188144 RepID=UPI00352E3591